MARRGRISDVASLIEGFNQGYDLIGRVQRDRDLREVSTAKPTTDTGFTPEQGEQLRAAAESGQYDVTWDEGRGQYSVRPKAAPDMEGAIAPGERTSFLGKIYDKAPDEATINRDRQMAMAGVLEKHGDPTAGLRMRDLIRRGDLDEETLKQTRLRGEREAAAAPLQQEALQMQVDAGRRGARKAEAVDAADADLQVAWKTRLTNPDGTQRQATPDDHLWMTEQRIYKLTDAGDMKGAQEAMQAHAAQSLAKLTLDTQQRAAAVDRAMAGVSAGDFTGVMEVYNKFLPDGATVTSIKPGKGGSLVIEREAGGKKLPPQTLKSVDELMVGLERFKDPRAAWQMSIQLADQAFKQRQEARAAGAHAAGVADKEAMRTAAVNLFREQNPNATPAQIEAVRRGVIPAVPERGNAPAEVKLAQALVASGFAPDMKTALSQALTKKVESPSEVYLNLMKPQGGMAPREADVAPVMEAVYGPGWREQIKAPGSGTAPARATGGPAKGQVISGYEFLGGDPNDRKNWRAVK